ncbi:hypothetical protein SAY87_003411 [Trapa incisa]|uniref:Protein MON2 homolog n=1 Tax=Trapa incisa TaxID=236973 RepID=A0AAN7KKJ2_9MYRT|nr:hypothetical protein SAY87_003411 [Trapa incisa]
MAFMAVLESDLRALSAEARRRYPAVKDGAEHAILKLRSLSSPSEIAHNEDILRIFLMACEVRTVKLSVIGLSCLQKLISHDAVAPSALKAILSTLKDHAEMSDESVQLKTLQTILIILQSHLHPENEEDMAQALGICLRLLENHRSSDSVRNTAAATFRQAVALIFDRVISAESLPVIKFVSGTQILRTSSVTGDISRSINLSESFEQELGSGGPSPMRECMNQTGKLGLRLLEDLTALAAGGSATWLHVSSLQRIFVLEILEFILSNYVAVFRILVPYEQVLQYQICSLLMTSLRTNVEHEEEAGEPPFRRLVLRSVAHTIRLYSTSLITECEVFLSMLLKVTFLDLPLWHRILVLEILRGFCVEARTLKILFQNFDMNPKNTNVVEGMVKTLARVVSSVQSQETSEESLAAVAGMFSSKAKGIEWSLDNDASNAAVLVASEAHAISLAVEGLLGVVFTVATLTDKAVDVGELESPRCEYDQESTFTGKTAVLCVSMVDSFWLTILDALSLILTRSQGEAIVLEVLKGYQAFIQACGVLHALEPLNSFLASLCKFTINFPLESERMSTLQSPSSKRSEPVVDLKDNLVLTPKNVQALRTLFNIAHRLHNVLGPSWVLVLETLAALDRAIHSPHATTQELPTAVPKLVRQSSSQYTDFNILSSLNSQLFESSALMHMSAVKSLLTALHQLSYQCIAGASVVGPTSGQKLATIKFSIERMISILVNNLHRVQPIWDQVISHFLELVNCSNQQLRNMALDALDQSICAVLGSDQFHEMLRSGNDIPRGLEATEAEIQSLECSIITPLKVLYFSNQSIDVRAASLKILLHVLERHGDKLRFSWPYVLELLRLVADATEKDLVTLGFQSLRAIMNDGLSAIPLGSLDICIDVTGAYSAQKTELNISLTALGLLWTATDFIARELLHGSQMEDRIIVEAHGIPNPKNDVEKKDKAKNMSNEQNESTVLVDTVDHEKLLFSVFLLLQKLGSDERPEVRNSAVRTLFQTLVSHGQKLSKTMWEDCLWNYVFPMLDLASHMAATSSKDEWRGKELGTMGGKAIHMLIHHSRNTAQKQWDETLVLVFGGIARLLRSFFPFLQTLKDFWKGWESLLSVVKDSTLNGSKEVALAAINCLQTAVITHSLKGDLPMPYLTSVIDVYDLLFRKLPSYGGNTANKAKQEILHGLGELYGQAKRMFDNTMYMQLLAIVDLAVKQSIMMTENMEDTVSLPPVQRTVLEVLPLLQPAEQLSSMWIVLLRELLKYLPKISNPLRNEEEADKTDTSCLLQDTTKRSRSEISNGNSPLSPRNTSINAGSDTTMTTCIPCQAFMEKLVSVLIDLSLEAPVVEKHIVLPEIIQTLGRSMTTRRDDPDGALWRSAVEGFNRVVINEVNKLEMNNEMELTISRPVRLRFWKEVADVYEIFLTGYCGRALSSNYPPVGTHNSDESLEMKILSVLGDKILKSTIDAPPDILQRIISTLDRCASRTSSLPIATVELMPSYCSWFSLTCLQKLFSLASFDEARNWNSTRSEVTKITIRILTSRCENILNRFLADENDLGAYPLPIARLEECLFVLKELALLKIHKETASVLPLRKHLMRDLDEDESHNHQPHLLVLYPALCELVISREPKVRELVLVLLRLVAKELSLEKVPQTS